MSFGHRMESHGCWYLHNKIKGNLGTFLLWRQPISRETNRYVLRVDLVVNNADGHPIFVLHKLNPSKGQITALALLGHDDLKNTVSRGSPPKVTQLIENLQVSIGRGWRFPPDFIFGIYGKTESLFSVPVTSRSALGESELSGDIFIILAVFLLDRI